jgi:hypothetical protein
MAHAAKRKGIRGPPRLVARRRWPSHFARHFFDFSFFNLSVIGYEL